MPARRRATLAEEGVVIPPTRLDDATLDALVARMRNPEERRGDFRAQLAAHRLAARASTSSARATAATASWRGDGRAVRLLRAARPRGDRGDARRRLRGGRLPRAGTATRDRRHARRSPATRSRSTSPARIRSTRRQPQLPARRHALGVLLRRPLPDAIPTCPPRAARSRPSTVRAPAGLPRQRAAARGGRRRQRRDVEPHRRRRLRRVRRRGRRCRRRARGR